MSEQRKKMLLFGTLAVIVLFKAGEWGYATLYAEPMQVIERKRESILKKISSETKKVKEARKTGDLFARWEEQSLPTDIQKAPSLYRDWLLRQVTEIGFEGPQVDSSPPVLRNDMYYTLSYSLRGKCRLDQLTQFLYNFYSANHLHQIRNLSFTPNRAERTLDVSMSIEALSLKTANRTDTLATGKSERLASDSLAAYRNVTSRDLFGYGNTGGVTSQTYLTGIVFKNGSPQAWLRVLNQEKELRLGVGDEFTLGGLTARVVEIVDADIVLDLEGERWLWTIGENLDQAIALPPEL